MVALGLFRVLQQTRSRHRDGLPNPYQARVNPYKKRQVTLQPTPDTYQLGLLGEFVAFEDQAAPAKTCLFELLFSQPSGVVLLGHTWPHGYGRGQNANLNPYPQSKPKLPNCWFPKSLRLTPTSAMAQDVVSDVAQYFGGLRLGFSLGLAGFGALSMLFCAILARGITWLAAEAAASHLEPNQPRSCKPSRAISTLTPKHKK